MPTDSYIIGRIGVALCGTRSSVALKREFNDPVVGLGQRFSHGPAVVVEGYSRVGRFGP
jgi:hypothetical protein